MGDDNKNLFLNTNGRIIPASVEKSKVYRKSSSSNTGQIFSNGMDFVTDQVISGKSFYIKLRIWLVKVKEKCNSLIFNEPVSRNEGKVTVILKPDDERNKSPLFYLAKKAEISVLVERNTWTLLDGNSITWQANIIEARLANLLKNAGHRKNRPQLGMWDNVENTK